MELSPLADLELTYTSLEPLDYGGEGQFYGTLKVKLAGGRLAGDLHLTNLAARRGDNVNLPTLRGVLTTEDGAKVFVTMDGIATLRPADQARVFVTTCRFRTGDERYAWLNVLFGVLEGVLTTVETGSTARGAVFECRATVA